MLTAHSLFEDGYLLLSLGNVAQVPDIAISELVANAWDAGASRVDVDIPDQIGGIIRVTDDGVGMTPAQFRSRWMKHGYNRVRNQGEYAEFPPERGQVDTSGLRPKWNWASRPAVLLQRMHGRDEAI